jgi:sigma-70-like protein
MTIQTRLTLAGLVGALPARDRRILTMRFSEELTQTRIAVKIGVSQMQASRLLQQSLDHLRLALNPPTVHKGAPAPRPGRARRWTNDSPPRKEPPCRLDHPRPPTPMPSEAGSSTP